MAKPAIVTPVEDTIQVITDTALNEQTITKEDVIAITDDSADNAVYSSTAQTQPNIAEADAAPAFVPVTSSVRSSDLKTVTGTKETLRGTIYFGTAKS